MSATWTCPNCDRSVIGSVCYCMASEEAKLHGRIAELSQRLAERDAEVEWLRHRLHACEQQLAMIHYHLVRENYSGWASVPVDLLVPLTQENLDRCDQEVS